MHCNALQCTATGGSHPIHEPPPCTFTKDPCNTLQLTITHCNMLQRTAKNCNIHCNRRLAPYSRTTPTHISLQHTATYRNALQHTLQHTLQQVARTLFTNHPHAHLLHIPRACYVVDGKNLELRTNSCARCLFCTTHHTAKHLDTLQHNETHCNILQLCTNFRARCLVCNTYTLQHTVSHCNTLKYTATMRELPREVRFW